MGKKLVPITNIILIIPVLFSACGISNQSVPTDTSPPKSTLIPATPTSPSINEPLHDIYAGYTDDIDIPFLILHKSGEKIGVAQDDGIVWSSPSGESFVIFTGPNGLPKSAVVNDLVVHYSNYTYTTVEVTIIYPNGTRETFRTTYGTGLSKRIHARIDSPSWHAGYFDSSIALPEQQDIWDKIDNALFDLDVAACSLTAYNAQGANLAFVPLLKLLGSACLGAFIDLKIKEGEAQNMDVEDLEALGVLVDAIGCEIGDPISRVKDCIDIIVTAMKTLRVKAVYAEENVPPIPASTDFPILTFYDGSYYELVDASPPVTWDKAVTLADSREHLACGSAHLATVTSPEEQAVISSLMEPTNNNGWLGGFQSSEEMSLADGWTWITGESFEYTNWDPPSPAIPLGEPNDTPFGTFEPGSEQGLETYQGSGAWNDAPSWEPKYYFIVEYEDC